MKSFEAWHVIVIIIQTGVILMAFIGALYFGFKQKEVNNTLAQIESYNYKQTKIQQDYKIIQESRDLRRITNKISSFFTWGTSKELEAINRRTHEDKLKIAKQIMDLLDDGLDYDLLKSNKKALNEWFNAFGKISGIIQNPTEYYKMEKKSGSVIFMGPIPANTFDAWKEDNKEWTITELSQSEVEVYNTKKLQEVYSSIMKVYIELDLSFTQLKRKLKEELSQENIGDAEVKP